MKIVVYWEDSDEESTAKKAARYLLSLFKKRGMPKAEIMVRSVGAGLADEAQRLADQMEAAFGEHAAESWTFEDEMRRQMRSIVFPDPMRDRSGWTLRADVHAMRSAPNPLLSPLPKGNPGPALPRSAPNPVYLGSHMSPVQFFGAISQADSPGELIAKLELNGLHHVGTVAEDGFTTFTPPGVQE